METEQICMLYDDYKKSHWLYRKYVKRILDILLSLLLLPLLFLCLIIVGPMIWLSDKGPIFYNSLRLGYHGKVFSMYKLRTMHQNAPDLRLKDGSTYNSDDDPRLTKIGGFLRKTSIDEIPQIINVLKGDMSFIGPRPDLPEHIHVYIDDENQKLNVRPGISGYNQAFYRNSVEWKGRLRNDVYYTQHLSFTLDCKVLIRTILTVFGHQNVYISERTHNAHKR